MVDTIIDGADIKSFATLIESNLTPSSVTNPTFLSGIAIADPVLWASTNREAILDLLQRDAALVFRDFSLPTPEHFEAFAAAICPDLYGNYGDLPKKEVGKKIYKSTPYPNNMKILFHNESSNTGVWPTKQFFFCEQPAAVGGATPLVDCRAVYKALPEHIKQDFSAKGLKYTRNFSAGFDVSWQDYFKTDSLDEVKTICERLGLTFSHDADDTITTEFTTAGVLVLSPEEVSFFNQVQLHHPFCLEPQVRAVLLELLGQDRLPRNVTFADGSVISDETMQLIAEAYESCAVRFTWQQGDVVMVDNRIIAHGRDEFDGNRKVVVAMADMKN
ncbi:MULTISPECIES: TauD/TfdA family dioxygenase [Pseudoalteromonas]|uniref:TauD/TfdA family dioxygenase n=1 Tax=Pseudoalteromonas TaxID=53246 RepID=UPI00029A39E9|nr:MULTISPECIES: TauD/TfdA family dioxygenase [Pseudoalteromonas]MBR8843004.1 TauD/TfdA family dioxygenase [Pseudoalteromonas sp. JC3]MCF7516423.1 TauD/TfdA family dioxygenase [Pseudoalteromonas sp. L7]MCF7528449.1 TauD/TfdA family dioxygenase [Pseudoalteromonas sp. L23]MCX2769562.1 TauD/TfdA family dioxygenase [Pseudoalteromonas sp. B530]NSY36493.1 TauD/TfdA family dioxygenase [Pseudoalteromonas sp. JC28]